MTKTEAAARIRWILVILYRVFGDELEALVLDAVKRFFARADHQADELEPKPVTKKKRTKRAEPEGA